MNKTAIVTKTPNKTSIFFVDIVCKILLSMGFEQKVEQMHLGEMTPPITDIKRFMGYINLAFMLI